MALSLARCPRIGSRAIGESGARSRKLITLKAVTKPHVSKEACTQPLASTPAAAAVASLLWCTAPAPSALALPYGMQNALVPISREAPALLFSPQALTPQDAPSLLVPVESAGGWGVPSPMPHPPAIPPQSEPHPAAPKSPSLPSSPPQLLPPGPQQQKPQQTPSPVPVPDVPPQLLPPCPPSPEPPQLLPPCKPNAPPPVKPADGPNPAEPALVVSTVDDNSMCSSSMGRPVAATAGGVTQVEAALDALQVAERPSHAANGPQVLAEQAAASEGQGGDSSSSSAGTATVGSSAAAAAAAYEQLLDPAVKGDTSVVSGQREVPAAATATQQPKTSGTSSGSSTSNDITALSQPQPPASSITLSQVGSVAAKLSLKLLEVLVQLLVVVITYTAKAIIWLAKAVAAYTNRG